MSETIKSKVLWSGIGALIVSAVTDIYNFAKMSITSQSIPIFIPIVFAIIGFGLIVYFFGKTMGMGKNVSCKSLTMLVILKTQKGKKSEMEVIFPVVLSS